jgi:hypothetical protein
MPKRKSLPLRRLIRTKGMEATSSLSKPCRSLPQLNLKSVPVSFTSSILTILEHQKGVPSKEYNNFLKGEEFKSLGPSSSKGKERDGSSDEDDNFEEPKE